MLKDYIQENLEGFTKEQLISHIRWLYMALEEARDSREELAKIVGIK